MKIITIDNGNSHPHVGIFENGKLSKVIPLSGYVFNSNDFVLISSVGGKISLPININLVTYFKDNFFFDLPVNYSNTLGIDRLLVAYSIYKNDFHLLQKEKILIIDAGTFMTLDFVSIKGFDGGYIFPGINSFLEIYQKGVQLPKLNIDNFKISKCNLEKLPKNTNEAILIATELYLESLFENILKIYRPIKIVITGGNGELILNKIASLTKTQVEIHPHLIHYSIHQIYQEHFHLRSE